MISSAEAEVWCVDADSLSAVRDLRDHGRDLLDLIAHLGDAGAEGQERLARLVDDLA